MTPGAASAQGEHSRRVAAELVVAHSDLQRLQQPQVPELQRRGLQQRVAGIVTGLEILLRLADAEQRLPAQDHRASAKLARDQLDAGEYEKLQRLLQNLQSAYPLQLPDYLPDATCTGVAMQLHRERCASCHDVPAAVERPAYNLYQEARQLSSAQMFARMLTGVRGDRLTGIDNPLSDFQIASLMSCYRNRSNSAD